MAEDKKTRRQWLYNTADNNVQTKETHFELARLTPEAKHFLELYGLKQYLADKISAEGGSEFSDKERADHMHERFDTLCDEKFKLIHTEAGYYWKDPDAVATKRGGIKRSDLVQGLIDSGKYTEEEALAFAIKLSQK